MIGQDVDGHFRLASIRPGEYSAAINTATEREHGSTHFVVRPEDRLVQVQLTTSGSGRIRVQATCGSDRPCGALSVTALHEESREAFSGSPVSEGQQVVDALRPGTYQVRAANGFGPPLDARVEFGAAGEVPLSFRFDTSASISGVIRDETGAPVMNAWVVASADNATSELDAMPGNGTLGPRAVRDASATPPR